MSLLAVGICVQRLASRIYAKRENSTASGVLQEEDQVFLTLGSAAAGIHQWDRLGRGRAVEPEAPTASIEGTTREAASAAPRFCGVPDVWELEPLPRVARTKSNLETPARVVSLLSKKACRADTVVPHRHA